MPEKSVTIRPRDKPWFDYTLRKNIRTRDRLRKKALNSKKKNYHKHRNKVNNMIKYALSNYYDSINLYISDARININKLYWKLFKDVVRA